MLTGFVFRLDSPASRVPLRSRSFAFPFPRIDLIAVRNDRYRSGMRPFLGVNGSVSRINPSRYKVAVATPSGISYKSRKTPQRWRLSVFKLVLKLSISLWLRFKTLFDAGIWTLFKFDRKHFREYITPRNSSLCVSRAISLCGQFATEDLVAAQRRSLIRETNSRRQACIE